MTETVFDELKRYIGFSEEDERSLRALHPFAAPEFGRIAEVFYARILSHEGARTALVGGESQVGHLKVTLVAWMDKLLTGPWDEEYFQLRCRIGRLHVRIALPQHYMFGAMNVVRGELSQLVDERCREDAAALRATRVAVGKLLDLELAVMLHTYREDLVAQAERAERLSTFGQLVGSIGHELRNPLGVMESSLYILKSRVTDERGQKHVARVGEQVVIANAIITNLLDMIRDRPLARERLRLSSLLDEAAGVVPRPPGVALSLDGLEALPAVSGDPVQVRQVFVNLLENAVYAAAPTGEVRVRGRHNGALVELAVEDTGPGVDAAIRRRLFEPLVTTKAKGIGLGLALVRRIVERHGGTIAYAPPEHGGGRFVVTLPAST